MIVDILLRKFYSYSIKKRLLQNRYISIYLFNILEFNVLIAIGAIIEQHEARTNQKNILGTKLF